VAIDDRQGNAKACFTHSTFSSMLLPRDTLRKQALEYVPSLTPYGAAARFVLGCCDGGTPLRQIEEETALQFPALFKSNAEAAAFVADIIKQYSA
jgi:hypothetical protein